MSAFDPVARIWVPREHSGAVGVPQLRGALRYDEASVRWAAEDFGHLVHHRPRAVLRPGSVADVAAIVRSPPRPGCPSRPAALATPPMARARPRAAS